MELTIQMESSPAAADILKIQNELRDFNRRYSSDDNYRSLTIFMRDAEQVLVGGLLGETYWGWLHISVLWIAEHYRGKGFGKKVLDLAENEAIARGCHSVHLDTMSFQAVEFYERHGYTTFGVLNDIPVGHSRHFLMKKLGEQNR